jgi:hypothetical protein
VDGGLVDVLELGWRHSHRWEQEECVTSKESIGPAIHFGRARRDDGYVGCQAHHDRENDRMKLAQPIVIQSFADAQRRTPIVELD